jgi:hypothetical protein
MAALCAVHLLSIGPTAGHAETEPEEQGFFGFTYEATERGARVTEVLPEGGTERAGFRVGDVVLAVEERRLEGLTEMEIHEALSSFEAGSEVSVRLLRDDEPITRTVLLAATPERYRVAPEERARVRRKMAETRAIEQIIAVVERSETFTVRRTREGELLVRPEAEGADWEPVGPILAEMLDQALGGEVERLAPGERLRVRGRLGDHRVDLERIE